MCGINGLVSASENEIRVMNKIIAHRGPDGNAHFIDKNLGLGHVRLAVIDLSDSGVQPMWSKDNDYGIVFNGEIYNFIELKNELSKDFNFFSKTDTEVILHGYIKWGEKIVEKLDGMFAFCIYDKKKQTLFCARDRFGKKPFYYTLTPRFGFSSEIKALLTIVKSKINLKALDEFMTLENTISENTLFEGIYELLPAHIMTYSLKNRKIKKEKYWDLSIDTNKNKSLTQWTNEIQTILGLSLKKRLVSDVPIGSYLSGGIDSSAITAFLNSNLPYATHTFSLIYDDPLVPSEEKYMNIFLNNYPNVKKHFIKLDCKTYWNNFVYCTWINDYPLVFPADIAQFLLAKIAKKKITVVLSGQGSDEIFGGYGRHRIFTNNNGSFHGKFSLLFFKFIQYTSFFLKLQSSSLINFIFSPELSQAMTINFFHEYRKNRLYCLKLKQFIKPIEKWIKVNKTKNKDYLSRYLYREIHSYLKTILHQQDRMNMACGVESRTPFLDYRFVENVLNIPQQLKASMEDGKIILKEALKGKIPHEILSRKKEGFTIPIENWLARINWGYKLLNESRLSEDNLFNQKEIMSYWKKKDEKGIYFLLALEIWYRLYIRKEPQSDIKRDLLYNFNN